MSTIRQGLRAQAVAAALARMHLAGAGFEASLGKKRGSKWWRTAASRLQSHLNREDFALIEREIRFQSRLAHDGLMRGMIHADLFRDNALFVDSELTGIIDFYYVCNDYPVYDLAITLELLDRSG